jgi:hypothetical protein
MNQKNEPTLDQKLIKLVQTKKPTNVKQLIDLTKSENVFTSEQIITEHILKLVSQGKITLTESSTQTPSKLSEYLKTGSSTWFWITIILATATALTIFTISETSALIIIRNILGVIFILFLPGYSLIRLLFPKKELDTIESTALSIGISLALVPMIGLILYYTPWGIETTPTTLALLTITIIFATAAIVREHLTKT